MARRTKHLRTLLIGALALAAIPLLALLFRGHATSAVSPSPSAEHEPEEARGPAGPATSSDAAPARVPALAPAAASPAPGAGREVGVEIVRAETREPVPEAQVWWWPRSPELASTGDFEEWLRAGRIEEQLPCARALRADVLGHVQVPEHEQGFVIVAAAGELWGCASFEGLREGPAQVVLARDMDLHVQVLDAQGAGVPGLSVALCECRASARFERLLSRTAGPDGLAVLQHAGQFLRALHTHAGEFVVGVQELFDPPLELRLQADTLPEQPIRFVLRPSGSCRVTLVDGSGALVGGALEAQLRFADAPGSAAQARSGAPVQRRSSRSGGELSFEHVELGRALAVEVRREGSEVRLEARGSGPRQPGEQVELRVNLEAGVAVLRGRALDGSGVPLGGRELCARIEGSEPRVVAGAEQRLWTSADGRFALPTQLQGELPASPQLVLCALAGDGSERSIGSLPLPAELRAGSNELGDCVLVDLPLLAAGRVVDESGQGLAQALVSALGEGEGLAAVRTDAAGAFELRARTAARELALRAELQGLVGEPLRVRVPARELLLVLRPGGSLEGSVLLDPSLQQSLVLVQVASDPPAAQLGSTRLRQDGRFALNGLAPGTYSLRVVYAPNASALATLEGLQVRAGSPTRDARLDPLDLRARQRLLELELVDERGQPVPSGRAYSRPSGESGARWSFAESSGSKLQLLCDGRALDVTLAAEGFLSSELEQLSESRRITLQRAAQLRLELAPGLALPDPPLQLGVELEPLEGGQAGGFVESRLAFFGPDGVLHCSSPRAGALRARIVVQRRGPGAAQLVHAVELQPRVLQVAAHAALQVFTIQVDPAALAAALAAARNGY